MNKLEVKIVTSQLSSVKKLGVCQAIKYMAFLNHCKICLVYIHSTEELSTVNLQHCWSSLQIASSCFSSPPSYGKPSTSEDHVFVGLTMTWNLDQCLHSNKGTMRCYETCSIEIAKSNQIINGIKKNNCYESSTMRSLQPKSLSRF